MIRTQQPLHDAATHLPDGPSKSPKYCVGELRSNKAPKLPLTVLHCTSQKSTFRGLMGTCLWGRHPEPILTQNGSNYVHSRKNKIATFHTLWSPGPLKGQNFANFGLINFSLDLAFNIRGHGENTPYSSSELNESDIVNRQSGGDKLKCILKFYIGGTCHVICACAMTI